MRIAIVGAGMTGLTAALECISKGHTVEIFEESDHIGGLASAFPTHGTYLEKTYHHIYETEHEVLSLFSSLNLNERVVWRRLTTGIFIGGVLYPFTSPLDLLRFTPISFLSRVRMGLAVLFLRNKKSWRNLSSISAQKWMRRWVGNKAYQVVWEPLLRGMFHEHYSQISMAWLWNRLRTRSDRVAYVQGSLQVVFETLQKFLEDHRAIIHLNTLIDGISSYDSGAHLSIRGRSERFSFDRVLCTSPSPVFAGMIEGNPLPSGYVSSLSRPRNLGAVCLAFSSPQSLGPFYWTSIQDAESPFVVCIQHTNLVSSSFYGGEHMYYLNTYVPWDDWRFSQDEAQITEKYLSYLAKIFPAFERGKVSETHLFRARFAQHIAEIGYEKIIPQHKTPLPHVHLANFSQLFPEDRSMNCAVIEGMEAARMIMNDQ
ncbi:MAG: FAD-dependent oxidoreductase [Candidatus Peribacteraceae bacterium]|nr:FAD-dependent oxidoreductase [Candidatus Peribacteraceae bacterium]MDD5075387.1 FAD-dependent oxidoreductase [Candidatus Peribacteraceae bacterium]